MCEASGIHDKLSQGRCDAAIAPHIIYPPQASQVTRQMSQHEIMELHLPGACAAQHWQAPMSSISDH